MANHLSITNPLYLAKNAPIEIKSRITSLANLTDITYPWVGMKFYSILEDKWYEVRTLKQGYLDYTTGSLTEVRPAGSEFVNFEIVPNLYIDTYRDDTSGQGQDGVGIDSILKTGEEGNYDIYTVTLTDGRTYEIRVRQGVDGITPNIGSNGNWFFGSLDTGVKAESTDGRGVVSITKNPVVGSLHTWTVTYTDSTTSLLEIDVPGSGGSEVIGSISLSDQAPTVEGVYRLSESGTYNQIGGITKERNQSVLVKLKDGIWTVYEIVEAIGYEPDEQFITVNSENELTLADKVNAPGTDSEYEDDELKVIHVKKGQVLNTAFFAENTRYVFKFKHDLGGAIIVFPPNVTLEFQGGRLENGNLVGDNTKIAASPYLIFKDIIISKTGTWDIEKAYSHWFNCAKDGYIIDYKTMLEYFYDDIETGITTAQEPITNPLPIVSKNTTNGKWRIGNTDTNLRYLSSETIPTLRVADDGVTYLFDDYEKMQFIYNGVRYDIGHLTETAYDNGDFVTRKPDLTTFTDDTYKLNQLLNLKAITTVIGDEGDVFMIKPIMDNLGWWNIDDDTQGLVVRDLNNRTVEINGILKCIPNRFNNYHVFVGNNCKHLTLKGSGGIHGDIQEHLYNIEASTGAWYDAGEAGMCLHVAGCEKLIVDGLKFHNAWGDGIFPSWNRISSLNDSDFMQFTNNEIACCRRTGIGYEKGDYAIFKQNRFLGHRNRRGIATFAGIDIEPFNSADTPIRYCKNLTFDNNTFSEFRYWSALRLERCIGAQIINNYFTKNNGDIHLLQCYAVTEDVTTTQPQGMDRKLVFGGVVIQNNISEDSVCFLGSYGNSIDYRNKVYMADNLVKNCHTLLAYIYLTEATIERNTVYNVKQSFIYEVNGDYVYLGKNLVHHYINPLTGNNRAIFYAGNLMVNTTSSFVYGGNIKELTIDNLKLFDLSPDLDGNYLTDGSYLPIGSATDLPTEIINDRMSYTGFMFNNFTGKKLKIRNLTTDIINFSTDTVISNNCQVDILDYKNTYDSEDLKVIEKLIVGDEICLNKQKGRVVKGAFVNIPKFSKQFIPNVTPMFTLEAQTVIYNEGFTQYAVKNIEYGTDLEVYSSEQLWDSHSPRLEYFNNTLLKVVWEGVGTTDNISNVTLYNSKGRKVLETTTNVVYEHDGTRFNVMDNISVGLTAERPLKAITKDGFRYYDTELEIEYVYKKSIDDWIEKT